MEENALVLVVWSRQHQLTPAQLAGFFTMCGPLHAVVCLLYDPIYLFIYFEIEIRDKTTK